MRTISIIRAATVAVLALAAVPAEAQDAAPPALPSGNVVVAVNPLGFLQFGPTVEAEALVGSVSIATGLRIPTVGLLSRLIDPELGFAWLLMAGARVYLDREAAPAGWFAGPRFEWGDSRSGGDQYEVSGWGLEVGRRWVRADRRAIAGGIIVGSFESESGLNGKFIMGVVSFGVVR